MKKICLSVMIFLFVTFITGCTEKKKEEVVPKDTSFTISGTIKLDSIGLSEVDVLVDGKKTTITDVDGKFTISNLEEGEYDITVEKTGHKFYPSKIEAFYDRDDVDFTANYQEPSLPPVQVPQDPNKIPAPTDGSVIEDFDNGYSSASKMKIVQSKWGASSLNKGTLPANVNYTVDGTLVLSGRGNYYDDPSLRNSGSSIVSEDAYGPGRFEMAAKMPQIGGFMQSIWTFYYENDNLNHEIDIEFAPVEDRGYQFIDNNNWLSLNKLTHEVVELKPLDLPVHNDGNWHTYAIEWSVKNNWVKFYMDDILTQTLTTNVPTYEMQLWIGTWQQLDYAPFSTSDMLVDWVSYTSFNETEEDGVLKAKPEYLSNKLANDKQYPQNPILYNGCDYNWISNSDFQGVSSAWKIVNGSNYQSSIIPVDYLGSNNVYRALTNTQVVNRIPYVYEDFEFTLKGECLPKVLNDGSVKVKVVAKNVAGTFSEVVCEKVFEEQSQDFINFEETFILPENTQVIEIILETTGDDTVALFDNFIMTKKMPEGTQ